MRNLLSSVQPTQRWQSIHIRDIIKMPFPSFFKSIFLSSSNIFNSLGRMFSGVDELDWSSQTPHLNSFGMNWNSNCDPNPISQHWCLTSLMWLNENKFPQLWSNISWKMSQKSGSSFWRTNSLSAPLILKLNVKQATI